MRNAPAHLQIIEPGRRTQEFDAPLCAHCGRMMLMKPGLNAKPFMVIVRADGSTYEREAGFCRKCYEHVCPACDGKDCKSRFAKADEEEAAARARFACI